MIKDGGGLVMLYRAQDRKGVSRLGYATSTRRDEVRARGGSRSCHRKPSTARRRRRRSRLVEIGGLFYLTYTAYNGKDAQLALATSTRSAAMGSQGRHHAGLQGPLERELDEGRRHPRRSRSTGGTGCITWATRGPRDQTGIASSTDLVTWTRSAGSAGAATASGAVRFARHRAGTAADR